jgi:hypothetical protein
MVKVSLAIASYFASGVEINGENPCAIIACMLLRVAQQRVERALVTTSFYGTFTRGFAAKEDPGVAVCLLPGTELAFEHDVRYNRNWLLTKRAGFRVARFCTIEPHAPHQHHDAIAFPDGNTVLVSLLSEGQYARVLQCLLSGRNRTSKTVLRKL